MKIIYDLKEIEGKLYDAIDPYEVPAVMQILDELAEMPQIVRCGECRHKYYDGNQIICQKLYWCDGNNFEPSAEDFCSRGERRIDED